jgi:hypothetical protein
MDAMDPVEAHEVGELVKERRVRNYRRLAGVLFGVAILGGVGLVVMQRLDKAANQKVDAAWSKMNRCLIGDPLADKELASVRLRRVQLTALTLPDKERTDSGGVAWPQRCGTFAHAVSETLHDAGRAEADKKDLAAASETFAKLLTDTSAQNPLTRDYGAAIDALYDTAKEEKVVAERASDVAAPPGDAAAPFTLDTLARVAPMSKRVFNLQSVMAESHASREIHLLIEDKTDEKAPWSLCTIDPSTIHCKKLPDAIQATKSGLRLLATTGDGAAPLIFAGNRGSDGVFRSDTGELVDKLYSYGGYTAKDGFAAVLGWDDDKKEPRLVRQKAGGKAEGEDFKPDLRIGNAFYGSALIWNQLVLRGVTKKDERRVVAESIDKGEKPAEGMKVVGALPEAGLIERGEEEPHISGCKSAEATVLRVKGYSNEFVAFDIGGSWHEPIGSEAQGGYITCRKAEATITRIDSWGLTQNRCTTAGCKSARVPLEKIMPTSGELAPRSGYLQAIDVDGQALVVWAAGEKGGIRYRFAPIERIAQAPDVVLYDDLVEGYKVGNLSTLFGVGLVAREGYAVIVLATKGGIVGLRVTPDGKVSAAPAQ